MKHTKQTKYYNMQLVIYVQQDLWENQQCKSCQNGKSKICTLEARYQ